MRARWWVGLSLGFLLVIAVFSGGFTTAGSGQASGAPAQAASEPGSAAAVEPSPPPPDPYVTQSEVATTVRQTCTPCLSIKCKANQLCQPCGDGSGSCLCFTCNGKYNCWVATPPIRC